jgi:hypothetical protein
VSPRGCLLSLLSFAAVVVLVLWFALPPVASGLAGAALGSAGFHGADTHVDVGADPPLKLLLLDADRVHVVSSDASILDVHADAVDVLLRGVSISRRTFDTVEGTLDGVTFTPETGPSFTAKTVQLTGPAEAARATLTVDKNEVQSMVGTAVGSATGQPVSKVTLSSPDRVSANVGGTNVTGRLTIDPSGQLVLVAPTGQSIALVGTGPDERLHLQSVQIAGQDLELSGVMDLRL